MLSENYGEYENSSNPARCENHDFTEWQGEDFAYVSRECKLCGFIQVAVNVDKKRGRK